MDLLLEEEDAAAAGVALLCEAEAGLLFLFFSLSGCGLITDRQYMKRMKSEGCLCHDYQQVHMTIGYPVENFF